MTPWWADAAGYEICLPWFTDGTATAGTCGMPLQESSS